MALSLSLISLSALLSPLGSLVARRSLLSRRIVYGNRFELTFPLLTLYRMPHTAL